jgi:hypothetical protein
MALASAAAPLPINGRRAGAAETSPAFAGIAAADGARFSMTVPNAPGTSTPIDGGGPSAQATVSSLGVSQAFASLPYPGDLPVRLPGLLAGVGIAGVPQYPFYASSDHPTAPDARLEAPGYLLKAASSEDRSAAEAAGQAPDGQPASYRSEAAVGPEGGGAIVAAASSVARNLRIGDLVIGEAVTRAEARLAGGGAVEREASFRLTGVLIAGTAVGIGPEGVTVGGTTSPLPGDNPLLAALAEQGIGIEYVKPLETAHGVVAGGVRITVAGTAPDGTRGTIAMTLGRATASVETAAGSRPSPTVGVEIGPDTGPAPATPAPGPGGEGLPADAGSATGAQVSASPLLPPRRSGPAVGPGTPWPTFTDGQGASPTPASGTAPEPGGLPPELARPHTIGQVVEPYDVSGFYPMVVVAAALAYAVAQGIRILGVR